MLGACPYLSRHFVALTLNSKTMWSDLRLKPIFLVAGWRIDWKGTKTMPIRSVLWHSGRRRWGLINKQYIVGWEQRSYHSTYSQFQPTPWENTPTLLWKTLSRELRVTEHHQDPPRKSSRVNGRGDRDIGTLLSSSLLPTTLQFWAQTRYSMTVLLSKWTNSLLKVIHYLEQVYHSQGDSHRKAARTRCPWLVEFLPKVLLGPS